MNEGDNLKIVSKLRPAQLITTFGPGSIHDAMKDSISILDIQYWGKNGKGRIISDPRLASYLRVNKFYEPNTWGKAGIPAISFPDYHVCSKITCGHIFSIKECDFSDPKIFNDYIYKGPTCPICGFKAYPSRFVVTCNDGHLDDFPYDWWVHKGGKSCGGKLSLRSNDKTSELSQLYVICDCGDRRSLAGAMSPSSFSELKCTGRHPHRPTEENEDCSNSVIPLQRGASNIYFPVLRSAISIPPWINPIYMKIDEHLDKILEDCEYDGIEGLKRQYFRHFKDDCSFEEFKTLLEKRNKKITSYQEIKKNEYLAIKEFKNNNDGSENHFKASEEDIPDQLRKYFSRIIKIERLREVMVLLGFTRYTSLEPDTEFDKGSNVGIVPLTPEKNQRWLPAVEIHGEGIFIEFNTTTLQNWLNTPYIKEISNIYSYKYAEYINKKNWKISEIKSAKYVLIHSFAHLLMKELSLECGYSSTALKERVYFEKDCCGVLIYTGCASSEGTLGGLIESGKIHKFEKILINALEKSLNCTNDPKCRYNLPDSETINGAACHACMMVSETSCESGNRLLDRNMVLTFPGSNYNGYFNDLIL